jgi:hypothetical protein
MSTAKAPTGPSVAWHLEQATGSLLGMLPPMNRRFMVPQPGQLTEIESMGTLLS